MKLNSHKDTIVAISTAMGQGGIGIIRLSGKKTLSIVDEVFVNKTNQKPSTFKSYSVHYGWIHNREGSIIDEVLLTVMRAPRSYTKEDIVEISCHGGMVSLRAILMLIVDLGARLAEPGEFTKRAFLNGRIDLAQAEAVLDIVQSKTDAFLRVSTNQLKGELSLELEEIRQILMSDYTQIEAIVNFPEDDIDTKDRKNILVNIDLASQRVGKLLDSSEHGRILKEGIKIVLCGKPNVGKSSLLNILLKQPRAIVSDIPGTTRDTIEETAQLKGIPFQVIDTAGIIDPRDEIEEEAVRRSHMNIESADLIIFVLDVSQELSDQDRTLIEKVNNHNLLILYNKCDLTSVIDESEVKKEFPQQTPLHVSALKKIAIDDLESAIIEKVWHSHTVDTHGVLVSNMRHIDSLKKCQQSLAQIDQMAIENISLEFISEEIKEAINHLDRITGRNIDSDLLENIFSQFCIGK